MDEVLEMVNELIQWTMKVICTNIINLVLQTETGLETMLAKLL